MDVCKSSYSVWHKANISVSPNTSHSTHTPVNEATANVHVSFQSWYHDAEFQEYTKRVWVILNSLISVSQNLLQCSYSPPINGYDSKTNVDFEDLTRNRALYLTAADLDDFDEWVVLKEKENTNHSNLKESLAHVLF